MRTSQYLIATKKETPADSEVISHQLMVRAGLIRKLASGIYTWLPLGLKVLRNVESIIREEMNNISALEITMPMVQPSDVWEESGRWSEYGPELLRLKDRHSREFCLGPTHEEVITDLIRNELKSYKQLPLTLYQIQSKFRDEVRPRFGVMRAREFVMKDAYSFHATSECLQQTYDAMSEAYSKIFSRLGLEFRSVLADSGSIGGDRSREFHVLAASGEDAIAFSSESDYAANIEMTEAISPKTNLSEPKEIMEQVATPNVHTISELVMFLKKPISKTIKTIIVEGSDPGSLVGLILRGDHQLNAIKAEKIDAIASPLNFASEDLVFKKCGIGFGSLGPVGLQIKLIADRSVSIMSDFICGANKQDFHLTGVNWVRDTDLPQVEDLRQVEQGDPSPDGKGHLNVMRGIEVGHIFQLGEKYTRAMNGKILDEKGKQTYMAMGCYGIGVSRIVAAAIEQNNDEKGIIWPKSIAPFSLVIIALNIKKSNIVREAANQLYEQAKEFDIDVLLDDRDERPGIKFADMELIGIPHQIIIGENSLKEGKIEYRRRTEEEKRELSIHEAIPELQNLIV